MARKSDLPDDVRLFIVERLACFDSPSTVVGGVKKEFGIEVKRQAVEGYDPTKTAGKRLSAKLREHFFKTREAFRCAIVEIPIASKAVRLRRLDLMCETAMDAGAIREAADLLEQAAKEVGGVYTGRGGAADGKLHDGPREPQPTGADHLAELSARFAKGLTMIEGGKK